MDALERDFDYADPLFKDAIGTIGYYGLKLPYDIQKAIIDGFRGDIATLKAIRAALEVQGIDVGGFFERYIHPLTQWTDVNTVANSQVTEFRAYSTSDKTTRNEWRSAPIHSMIRATADALDVDLSVNPVAARLSKLINDPATPDDIRRDAAAAMRLYNKDLAADDTTAMRVVTKKLDAWGAR